MSISSYLALIIIVIVINALKSAQKKKEAEEARRMPTAKAQQPKQSAPKVHSQPIVPTPAPMPAHAHTTVHAAKPKVHEHLAAECDLDAELQGSIGYDSPEGRDKCHEDELVPGAREAPGSAARGGAVRLEAGFQPECDGAGDGDAGGADAPLREKEALISTAPLLSVIDGRGALPMSECFCEAGVSLLQRRNLCINTRKLYAREIN